MDDEKTVRYETSIPISKGVTLNWKDENVM